MEKRLKTTLTVLSVLCVCSAYALFFVITNLISERRINKDLHERLDSFSGVRENVENTLSESNLQIRDLQEDLREAQAKVVSLQDNINRVTSLRDIAQEKLRYQEDQFAILQEQFNTLLREKDELEVQLAQNAPEESEVLEAEEEPEVTAEPMPAEENNIFAREEIPLAQEAQVEVAQQLPITPEPAVEEKTFALLEGEILAINEDFNFVVINLGRQDGVNAGDVFVIMDDGSAQIGSAIIQKVYVRMSSANLSANTNMDDIRKGLKVVRE